MHYWGEGVQPGERWHIGLVVGGGGAGFGYITIKAEGRGGNR